MVADAFIQCRVTSENKALIHALARQQGVTDSALVKQLLGIVLRSAVALGAPNSEPADSASRDARLYVRLDPNDRLLLKERAAARGVPSATYIAALARSHLRGITPLMKEERLALDRVVAELSAVGRNLNQIARALNRGQGVAPGRREVQVMLKLCSALRDHVKALLAVNARNWNQGHAETTH